MFSTYSNLHTLATDQLHGAHDVLLHLHELGELLCEVGTEGARVDGLAEVVACERLRLVWLRYDQRIGCDLDIPMLVLPKNLPLLVVAEGGGGFWICEAVGARDWRMEYVRCMMAVVVGVVCGVWFGEYNNVGIEVCKVEEKGQERESVIEALLCRMLS